MTQELRIVMFTDEELAQAIALYMRRQGLSQVDGALSILRKDGHPRIEVEYAIGFGADEVRGRLAGESLAGALVLCCIERRIPLRRQSQKILHIMDGCVVLILNQDFPTATVVRLFVPPAVSVRMDRPTAP